MSPGRLHLFTPVSQLSSPSYLSILVCIFWPSFLLLTTHSIPYHTSSHGFHCTLHAGRPAVRLLLHPPADRRPSHSEVRRRQPGFLCHSYLYVRPLHAEAGTNPLSPKTITNKFSISELRAIANPRGPIFL